MVISDAEKTAFVHIPKNGGMSLRNHFGALWPDARAYRGAAPVEALGGAIRDLSHMTVREAEAWFGEQLVENKHRIIIVVRPPMTRVHSALYHYLRVMQQDEKDFIPTGKALALLDQTRLRDLCIRADSDPKCVHFRRQVSFIEGVPGGRVELVAFDHLADRFPEVPHVNKAGRLPGWLRAVDNPLSRWVVRVLGARARRLIRDALTRRDTTVERRIATMIEAEADFLRAHYAEDEALYRRALASAP